MVSDRQEGEKGTLAGAVSEAWVVAKTLFYLATFRGDEAYSKAIGNVFLKPFCLTDRALPPVTGRHFFAWRREKISRSGLPEDAFHFVVRKNRPYHIVNATLITKEFLHGQRHLIPLEITPDYVGTRWRFDPKKRKSEDDKRYGGMYMQSFAYDFRKVIEADQSLPFGPWKVKTGRRTGAFSLSDVAGVSGSAPQDTLTKMGLGNLGFTEFNHWPRDINSDTPVGEFYHGDGGHVENQGLMPLLARRVQHIIAFVNSATPFRPRKKASEKINKKVLDKHIIAFFRQADGKYGHNLVFEGREQKLGELISALEARKRDGKPLIYCDTYDILENKHYGIHNTEGYRPKICWIYQDRTEDWLKELPTKVREKATDGWGQLPHYKTFFQNWFPPRAVDLTEEEVNLMSNLTAWTVVESAGYIREEFNSLNLP
jgi:hypothetical protein